MVKQYEMTIPTRGRGFTDLTHKVQALVGECATSNGICQVFIRHTSASLILCENADPDVRTDLESFMSRLVPDGDSLFEHTAEGPDDMPAHVRSVLTASTLSLPIRDGQCALGTWQGIYLWEHRTRPHQRQLIVTVLGS